MKSVSHFALVLATVFTFNGALAADRTAETDSASPTIRTEDLQKAENADNIAPDVVVAPSPTPAQQLRLAIDLAQEGLAQDLSAAREALDQANGPEDRMRANLALQRRKLAFEVEVFALQLEHARAIEAGAKITELEATLLVARERLDSLPAAAQKPEVK